MSTYTNNLHLFKYDTTTDGQLPFSINDALNDNWDKIDSGIPTKTSQLTNDSGFLTSHQSLANYVNLTGAQTISGAKTFTGTIKVPASTTAGSALQYTAGSKANNGYITLGNGLIIQWGRSNTDKSDSDTKVTYPTAFPTRVNSILITRISGASTTSSSWIWIRNIQLTYFKWWNDAYTGICWIAIGL